MIGRAAAVRRRRLGAVRHDERLEPGARPRGRDAGEARRAAAAVARRGAASTTCCRSTTGGSSASTPTSPAGRSSSGQVAAALRRHGPADRELGDQHEEQVALGDGRGRRARRRRRGRDHRPGRRLRRLEPLREGRQAGVLLQPARPAAVQGRGRHADPDRRRTRCGWSSPTTAAASPRAARSRSTSTASRSARAGSRRPIPMVFSGDETADVGSRHRLAGQRRLRRREQRLHRDGQVGADRHRRGRRGRSTT